MKSDYRYANSLVYNTFPWPKATEKQKQKIEKTAQAIIDARALYMVDDTIIEALNYSCLIPSVLS